MSLVLRKSSIYSQPIANCSQQVCTFVFPTMNTEQRILVPQLLEKRVTFQYWSDQVMEVFKAERVWNIVWGEDVASSSIAPHDETKINRYWNWTDHKSWVCKESCVLSGNHRPWKNSVCVWDGIVWWSAKHLKISASALQLTHPVWHSSGTLSLEWALFTGQAMQECVRKWDQMRAQQSLMNAAKF